MSDKCFASLVDRLRYLAQVAKTLVMQNSLAAAADKIEAIEASNKELLAALQEVDARIGAALVGLADLPERKLVITIRHAARSAIAKATGAEDSARMEAGFGAALELTRKAVET